MSAGITPVTVLTGFLGSGKTTLLNRALADSRFRDTAVIVNEWGEIPVDHALVREADGEVVVLAGGCICCRMAGDVARALRELHFQRAERRIPDFARVVIETTGLADPAGLLATLVQVPVTAARFALGGVIATVDAEHGAATLDAHPEARVQAAVADRLVLTKQDRAAVAGVAALRERLSALNPATPILDASLLDPSDWLQAGLYRGRAVPANATGWLGRGTWAPPGAAGTPHDPRIRSFAWRRPEPAAWEDVESALEAIVDIAGPRLLRLKGLVEAAGEPGPRAVHAVRHTLYPSARLPAWPDAARGTTLVFIVRDLEEGHIAGILEKILTPATP